MHSPDHGVQLDVVRFDVFVDGRARTFRNDSRDDYLRPYVNCRDFLDHVMDWERPMAGAEGHPDLAGSYGCLSLGTLEEYPRYLLGEREVDGRVALYVCPCGEEGCWPLEAQISIGATSVTWHRFSQPHRRRWSYGGFGPFVFDRAQYEQAVDNLVAHVRRTADRY
jgi:hypothetical protein